MVPAFVKLPFQRGQTITDDTNKIYDYKLCSGLAKSDLTYGQLEEDKVAREDCSLPPLSFLLSFLPRPLSNLTDPFL